MDFAWKDLVFAARDGEVPPAPPWTTRLDNACPIAQGMVTSIWKARNAFAKDNGREMTAPKVTAKQKGV